MTIAKVFKVNRDWVFVLNLFQWQLRIIKDGYRASLKIVLEKEYCLMRRHNLSLKDRRPDDYEPDESKLYHGGLCHDCEYICEQRLKDWSKIFNNEPHGGSTDE